MGRRGRYLVIYLIDYTQQTKCTLPSNCVVVPSVLRNVSIVVIKRKKISLPVESRAIWVHFKFNHSCESHYLISLPSLSPNRLHPKLQSQFSKVIEFIKHDWWLIFERRNHVQTVLTSLNVFPENNFLFVRPKLRISSAFWNKHGRAYVWELVTHNALFEFIKVEGVG